ncbi:MAG: SDR family oxidoreductase [Planctomycetaceae bacterium]|nr:SDR family oxidoreductase [Planctomycetaceae bacterium]
MTAPAVLVTGGSRGIGAAIARTFAAAGYRVAVNYRKSRADAEAVATSVGGVAVKGDVGQDAEALVQGVVKKLGRLDVLINNAGASEKAAWTDDLDAVSDEMWERILGTDLRGTFQCCRAAARVMKKGKIINVTSIPALTGEREGIVYSIAKAGVLGMTKSLAMLLAPRIQVNCMALGSIETGWVEWLPPALRKSYASAIPVGRFGKPEEAGELALFLAGNDWVTGQTYVLDGGETRV